MKGVIASTVGVLLLLGLTACGNSTASLAESSSQQTPNDVSESSDTVSDAASDSSSADEAKTLIVYFSATTRQGNPVISA